MLGLNVRSCLYFPFYFVTNPLFKVLPFSCPHLHYSCVHSYFLFRKGKTSLGYWSVSHGISSSRKTASPLLLRLELERAQQQVTETDVAHAPTVKNPTRRPSYTIVTIHFTVSHNCSH